MDLAHSLHPKAIILLETAHYLILDKPDGVLSHPNPDQESTKASIIHADYDFKGEFFRIGTQKLFLLHRIDKETSGCLFFSKDASVAKKIKSDFENHLIHKEYIALVGGILRAPTVWKDHLVKKNGRMTIDKRAKPNSTTEVEPIQVYDKNKLTLLRLIPKSGRTHQLRIQSSKRSLPILGDRQHGDFAKNKNIKTSIGLKRMFLHASKLEFTDPTSKKKISVESPLPLELHTVIDRLNGINT